MTEGLPLSYQRLISGGDSKQTIYKPTQLKYEYVEDLSNMVKFREQEEWSGILLQYGH